MTIHVEATYIDGVLRPKEPLHIPNGAEVVIAVETSNGAAGDPAATLARLRRFRGMLGGLSREQLLADRRQGLH
jgi:predicted DNA-binding antitoxin AbrB/MazE fold protein